MKKNPNLTAEQKLVMFEDGTEPPGTSELNNEKREGSYHCANCDIKLFDSKTKYESGSGWPSFYKRGSSLSLQGNKKFNSNLSHSWLRQ